MRREFVHLNGIRYGLLRAGEGPPLLLLHGFTGSAIGWRRQIELFSSAHTVFAPDLIGHGLTDSPEESSRYTMPHACADLVALLDVYHVEQVHLLGYSMGGRLALYFALQHPERVASLVLESASPGLRTAAERTLRREQDNALADRLEREGIEWFVDYWENLPLWESQQQTLSAEARQIMRRERLSQNPRGLANSLRGMGTGAQPVLWDELHRLTMPVQLIAGAYDEKFIAINTAIVSHLRRGRLDMIAKAGHAIHVEQSERFHAICMAFYGSGNSYSQDQP